VAKPNPTLSALFAPPAAASDGSEPELHGIGGVLCAYSADAQFLEHALLRFTRVPAGSRLARGSVDFTLLLDPKHLMLGPEAVAGLMVLRPRDDIKRPHRFAAMHAKVALLAFGPARLGSPTHYRLIVSTGNWTRASARHLIEMVWSVDVVPGVSSLADLGEIHAAAAFLRTLLTCYQSQSPAATQAHRLIGQALTHALQPKRSQPVRFLSTLPWRDGGKAMSVWKQLRQRLSDDADASNYLICGSGSYERLTDPSKPPEVLTRIITELKEKGGLTQSPMLQLVVNPGSKDQVIASYRNGTRSDWELHIPKDVAHDRTQLHAKFLFIAKRYQDSLRNPWLYLGSSNLTHPGFLSDPPTGNVEAGVLIPAPQIEHMREQSRYLPVGPLLKPKDLAPLDGELSEEPPQESDAPACPVVAFSVLSGGLLRVHWDPEVPVSTSIETLGPAGERTVLAPGQANLRWAEPIPRCLEVRWDDHACKIPYLDESGQYLRQVAPIASFASWLEQLRRWSDPDPAEEDLQDDDGDGDGTDDIAAVAAARMDDPSLSRDFPARTAMMLVEEIAERNGEVSEAQAADWLHYLGHMLQNVPPAWVTGWQDLRVNFLRALQSPEGFAPDWKCRDKYNALIDAVASAWGLASCPPLEVTP